MRKQTVQQNSSTKSIGEVRNPLQQFEEYIRLLTWNPLVTQWTQAEVSVFLKLGTVIPQQEHASLSEPILSKIQDYCQAQTGSELAQLSRLDFLTQDGQQVLIPFGVFKHIQLYFEKVKQNNWVFDKSFCEHQLQMLQNTYNSSSISSSQELNNSTHSITNTTTSSAHITNGSSSLRKKLKTPKLFMSTSEETPMPPTPVSCQRSFSTESSESIRIKSKDVRTWNPQDLRYFFRTAKVDERDIQIFSMEWIDGEVFMEMNEREVSRLFKSHYERFLHLQRELRLKNYRYRHSVIGQSTNTDAVFDFKTKDASEYDATINHEIQWTEAVKVVLKKILSASNRRGLSPMPDEELYDYALSLSDVDKLKSNYLNKEFEGVQKILTAIQKTFNNQQEMTPTNHSNGTKRSIKNLLASTSESQEFNSNFESISSKLNSAEDQIVEVEDEEEVDLEEIEQQDSFYHASVHGKSSKSTLKVKLVIAEIAKKNAERTFRKVLSPIIKDFSTSPQLGFFHSAILIGPWYLEWNNSSLIVPRRCYSNAAIMALDLDELHLNEKMSIDAILDIVAQTIVDWNVHKTYHQLNSNCQHFIDHLCARLQIKLNFKGCLAHYLSKLRDKGHCTIKWKVPDVLRERCQISSPKLSFATHKELDECVAKVLEACPLFEFEYPEDYLLLKSFDRAFWLRYMKAENAETAPLMKSLKQVRKLKDLNREECECPFGNPHETLSILKGWN